MTADGRVIFHIGYMKTGSTSIQHNLLNDHRHINYLAANAQIRNEFQADPRTRRFVAELSGREDGWAEKAFKTWNEHIAPQLAPDKTNIVSEEDVLLQCDAPDQLFARIKRMCPQAHILIVVRDQIDLIRSLYDMYPTTNPDRAGHETVPFDTYLDWAFGENAGWFDRMKFDAAILPAYDHFDSERIHVLSFKSLFTGDKPGLRELAQLLDIDPSDAFNAMEKPASNEFQMHASRRMIRRILGPIRASWFLPLPVLRAIHSRVGKALKFKKTALTAAQRDRIAKHYEQDNRRFLRRYPRLIL